MHSFLKIAKPVLDALDAKHPVVALESTLISHGLPYPDNIAAAQEIEKTVRRFGAVPATIGCLDGRIVVGLNEPEIARLANGTDVLKVSRRDLPQVLAEKREGATTVAATMIAAAMAGIRVFSTGGIGGVHRDAANSFDISADLPELARTSVAVVCSGAKSILDLPKTLEWLETAGVPVIGYGTDQFPAFFSRRSGLTLSQVVTRPEQVAHILKTKWDLCLEGGVVIANPPPATSALDPDLAETAIAKALAEAATEGISGKAITPFLLTRIRILTGGKSLTANLDLIKENAALGAQIAVALSKI